MTTRWHSEAELLIPLVQASVQIEAGAVKVDGGKHG